ncbi:MAG: quinone-dependent dihydroorotate dehydrogenase [Alphaproteobacteria bacterium]|nr:quinone-dependent dihydroorotate dehydrogenase [Alphaproteobacteria bacterium]
MLNELSYRLLRPALFCLDPEAAHDTIIDTLAKTQHGPLQWLYAQERVSDPLMLAGLRFPNRVGMAAGLDKNARCIDALAALGFGFVEVGTVTPLGQPGNPKPRIFRLPDREALINRLGFNNDGLQAFLDNVRRARSVGQPDGIRLGLNIGKNAFTPIERAVDDYLIGLQGVYPHADYITVNISSPNTQNLRRLQTDKALDALLSALTDQRHQLCRQSGRQVPLFVKIAPDLDEPQIDLMAATLRRRAQDSQDGAWGLIATNTTLDRSDVSGLAHAQEAGGLSGAPVREKSNHVIRRLRTALGPTFPIIGVGGILSGADAAEKIQAGADLVQIYTGLIYKGPALVQDAAQAIRALR